MSSNRTIAYELYYDGFEWPSESRGEVVNVEDLTPPNAASCIGKVKRYLAETRRTDYDDPSFIIAWHDFRKSNLGRALIARATFNDDFSADDSIVLDSEKLSDRQFARHIAVALFESIELDADQTFALASTVTHHLIANGHALTRRQ